MEGVDLIEKNEIVEGNNKELENGCSNDENFSDLAEEKGVESSSSSEFLSSEMAELEEQNQSSSEEEQTSQSSMGWPVMEISTSNCTSPNESEDADKKDLESENFEKNVSVEPTPELELEMMKERFAKLLLGEDMSGCGNGVSTALAISNAITNLCGTIFGEVWRLEPVPIEKKAMWRREMEWLICVSDYIVELKPTWQTFPDGTKLEVMTCRPRSDLYVNLPALRKLDNMLLEILESFENREFRYVDQGVLLPDGSSSFSRTIQRQEEKWWLPVPQVPPFGLHENSRNELQHKRDSTNQILKAAMAINSATLAEMDIPDAYLDSLPKSARATLGDVIYPYITSDNFSPESLLASLEISSEHQATEIANRVEASIHIWHRKNNSKSINLTTRSSSRSSWTIFRDLIVERDKGNVAERAESLLLTLKQRFPSLPQTTLDTSKIQYNKDVGKSILESYSRVLESLASNIVARIDDVLYVDDLTKHSDQLFSSMISKFGGVITHNSFSVPYCKSPFVTPKFSHPKGEKSTCVKRSNFVHQGVGVNKVLKESGFPIENLVPKSKTFDETPIIEADIEFGDCDEDVKLEVLERA